MDRQPVQGVAWLLCNDHSWWESAPLSRIQKCEQIKWMKRDGHQDILNVADCLPKTTKKLCAE